MRSRVLILGLVLASVLATGCRNRQRRSAPASCPPPSSIALPPQNIPDGQPPIPGTPRGTAPDPAAELLLPQDPNKSRADYPRVIVPPGRGAILGDPIIEEKSNLEPKEEPKADPPVEANKVPAASGIPDFSLVKDGVHAGKRPEIEGLEWLKANGYKTVINLRGEDEDDTTDKRQVEAREMKYVSLVISAEKLTQSWIDEFNRLVGDAGSRPIFVYGRDEAMTASIWYLHLRLVEFLTHDEARVRAGRLGLKDETSATFKAVLKLLPPNS